MTSTQICLVSDQPLPNLVPALAATMACRRAVLLVTPPMARRAQWLADVLAAGGVEPLRYSVEFDDLPRFRARVAGLLRQYPDAALNATGGQKPMAIAAFDAARSADRPVFYLERDNRLTWLHPIDRPGLELPGVLDLAAYFAAFGQTIAQARTQALTDDGGLAMLDRLEHLPPPGPGTAGQRLESIVFRALGAALAQAGSTGRSSSAWSLRTAGSAEDEFDIVAIRNNVLHLVECKHAGNAGFNGFLNKLDNLRRRRGITARAALVTTALVPAAGGNARRAAENGILLLGRDALPALVPRLADWLGN